MIPETLKQLSLKVCQYFLDFLESDFKRQQAPRRRVILQTDSGFKAGMSLAPYRSLQTVFWQKLAKPWDTGEIVIAPRAFTRALSHPLILILREQIAAIRVDSVQAVILETVNHARRSLPKAVADPEEWVASVREKLADSIGAKLVRPMLSFVDTALKSQAYSSIDSIFVAESDLIAALAEPLDSALPPVLARFFVSRDTAELMQTSVNLLHLEFAQATVQSFFESFAASDAFLEFRDLETYVSTAENLKLYLYIGTIKYGSTTYPLFFLPIETQRDEKSGTYVLRFTNQLYANKRAVDFILQELGERQQRQWLSPIPERITYLGTESSVLSVIEPLAVQICRVFGFLEDLTLAAGPVSQRADSNVSLANSLYICAFESTDEALLNDYEEMIAQIRTNKEGVVDLFQAIVGGVITTNPESIAAAVGKQWDDTPLPIRAVPDTPIPLNEEQQKVLQAIRHDQGRFIVVEGPPGTGKSHTIVAIAADCAFRQKSCLILSDKAEALEVVYNKLSAAMNEARGSEDFPNPLLRLGTEQANFRRLTSANALTQIGAHVKAANANRSQLESDRDRRRTLLREQIDSLRGTLGAIKTKDIVNLQHLGEQIDELAQATLSAALDQICEDTKDLPYAITAKNFSGLEHFLSHFFSQETPKSRIEFGNRIAAYSFASEIAPLTTRSVFELCPRLTEPQLSALSEAVHEAEELKLPVLGWLFRGRRLRAFARQCQSTSTFRKELAFPGDLKLLKSVLDTGRTLLAKLAERQNANLRFDAVYDALSSTSFPIEGLDDLHRFLKTLNRTPEVPALSKLLRSESPERKASLWVLAIQYASRFGAVSRAFSAAPTLHYVARKTEVERLNTTLMNSEVDSRLVNFMENSRSDAKVLAKLIKDRQKFPETKFDVVKHAFPVMIASIREFGEYMPLNHGMLDVLVIDEASQVSVAQAFPALLRAKKVVVMGDGNQFSNTKSSNASIALNQRHRGQLEAFFKKEVSNQADMLERLAYFDVKRSILDFCQLCANFTIMLRKHFRSYKELINYSSVTFYRGQLQAIKLRTLPLNDCIEFTELDFPPEVFPRNTNSREGEYILQQCIDLLSDDSPPTVGIVTPFREQQAYLSRLFSNHARSNDFRSRLKLKIMTFDSCQGEERKIIFYSMVATRNHDLLNYIFPVQLENADELVGEKLKIQRLNVGFSRAQEMVWFVLSKPLSEYKGAIGQALRHFQRVLVTPVADKSQTDPLSPMEQRVLDWIYATSFYQTRMDTVEVSPQFPLGDYLKQLDPLYKHPAWRVDFLLSVEVGSSVAYIVIEYDGFEYHFKKGVGVDVGNHERFLNDSDIERQLTLESYGYRFLRLNRFNLGRDPVVTLSERLEQLLESALPTDATGPVKALRDQAAALVDGTAKKCERCGSIKPLKDFFDKALGDGSGGTGRICLACKDRERGHAKPSQPLRRRRRWRRY